MAAAPNPNPSDPPPKRKRNLPGTPDPEAEVIALSPATLLSVTCYTCDVCGKEFRREQNLRIHHRGHRLPWKLPALSASGVGVGSVGGGGVGKEKRRSVYVCPEEGCKHHEAARALGDLTGIKKHYLRKHGEKRWECDRCGRKYAVATDWKAHVRACVSRQYECLCGTLFSRKESFEVHRASCSGTMEDRDEQCGSVAVKANTVNSELLFPSLWGRVSGTSVEDKEGQRSEGGNVHLKL